MNKILRYSFVALLAMVMESAFAQKEVVIDFNSMSIATSSSDSDAGDINEAYKLVGDEEENVVLLISPKAETATNPNRFWQTNNGPQLRCYSGSITIQAKFAMKSITFDAVSGKFDMAANVGTLSSTTWIGDAKEVVFTVNKNTQINKITISGESTGTNPSGGDEDHIANTAETAYTVAKAIELIDAGKALTEEVYVKGKISQIDSYKDGTINYWISDDGSTTDQFECYKGKGLNGDAFTSVSDLKKGATVIVKGKLKKYNSTYEFDSGNVLVSYDESTAVEEKHIANTEETAYTVAEAIALIDAGESLQETVFVKGIVSKVDQFKDTYKSIDYWISDDGTTESAQFECYSGKGIGGADFESVDDIKVGATVIVKGTMKKYKTTYEFNQNNELVKYDASTAGIQNLKAQETLGAIYNLAGQQVEKAQKGIFIQNGKKFVVK